MIFNGQAGVDPWRQTYSITNSGPAMRLGRNLYLLRDGTTTPLTTFKDGFVADCEVSWDGKRIIFSRRLNGDMRNYKQAQYTPPMLKTIGEPRLGGPDDPWWHVWEINVDGTGLRKLTDGPYHHVAPTYLPDGRIVCSSSRLGTRDEMLQLQVLDSDRRVVGNQTFWMYARPGETRSCVGCHEPRNEAKLPNRFASTAKTKPIKMLPTGGEFAYLGKAWMKEWLPDEMEERTRTVHAIELAGRY